MRTVFSSRDGEISQYCREYEYEETLEILTALGRNYVVKSVVELTCTEVGYSNVEENSWKSFKKLRESEGDIFHIM